jgi:hypothetical protein
MSRAGKIGYALAYNAIFLLILPVVRLLAGTAGWVDLLLAALAVAILVCGLVLLNMGRDRQGRGLRPAWSEPLRLWRDRLARGLIAGSMIWFNIYLVISNYQLNTRANPQAWSFFNRLALVALGLAWILVLTSPSDLPQADNGEA